ncbi:hypothetical protein SLH49_17665 [Cognatiyoonia sp. IB215446]|uniref:hypothetical protein n=1 Tax=Cognatiyoonia sp. IB215446 TaxID=3097355 RepID=UPI002A0E67A3|nr:hypothetical protein [Cognatiyoonia sp. IB215446]MDX8349817.1 hypothetical protein [Cognatiyoonia sp. IB215446]
MEWQVFRELYLKVLLSVFTVIVAMLLLQGALNQLKLRALVAEATSSRQQISASSIERSVLQAEALGFAIDEMTGLQDLIDRERADDPSIVQIAIVSPIGAPLLSSGSAETTREENDRVLRRVIGSQERMTRFDAGERLYTGRLLFDSSGAIMGAIVIVAETDAYMAEATASLSQMRLVYLSIFVFVAVLLVPFVMLQFAGIRHAFNVLDPRAADAPDFRERDGGSPEAAELQAMLKEGAAKVDELRGELDKISSQELGSKGLSS